MTLTATPKEHSEIPDLRLELQDYLDGLRQEQQRVAAYLQALMGLHSTAATNGWVVKGFTLTTSGASLTATLDAVESVAFDSVGRLLLRLAIDGSLSVVLPTTTTTRLSAFVYYQDSDYDQRRRYDRGVPGEVGVNDYTRRTPVVALHQDSTGSPPTHYRAPSGATVPLVPLYDVTTDGTGVTLVTDVRPHFADLDDTKVVGAAPSYGAGSLRDVLDLLATRFLQVLDAGNVATSSWTASGGIRDLYNVDLEVKNARVSALPSGFASLTLVDRIHAARAPGITVGDGSNHFGDYNQASGLLTALNYGGAAADGKVKVRSGTYSGVEHVSFSKDGVHVEGVRGHEGSAGTVYIPKINASGERLSIDTRNGITIEGIQFDATAQVGDWYILIRQGTSVRFIDCYFRMGVGNTESMIQIADSTKVSFEGCTFYQEHLSIPMVKVLSPTSRCNEVRFRDCRVESEGPWLSVQGNARGLYLEKVQFSLENGGGGAASVSSLVDVTTALTEADLHLDDCTVYDNGGGTFARVLDLNQTSGSLTARVGAVLRGCIFQNMTSQVGRFSGLGSPVRLDKCDLRFTASNQGVVVANNGALAGAASVVFDDCEFFYPSGSGGIAIYHDTNAVTHTTHDMSVTRCRFRNCSTGVYLATNSSTYATRVEGCTFYNNTSVLVAYGSAINGLRFCDNQIEGGGNTQIDTVGGKGFAASLFLSGGHLNEVRIEGNTWRSCGKTFTSGGVAVVLMDGVFNDVSVSRNKFFDCYHENVSQATALRYYSGHIVAAVNTTKGRGLDVVGNTIISLSFGSFLLFDPGNDGGGVALGVDRLNIEGNRWKNNRTGTSLCGVRCSGFIYGVTAVDTVLNIDRILLLNNLIQTGMQDDPAWARAVVDFSSGTTGTQQSHIPSYACATGNTIVGDAATPPTNSIALNSGVTAVGAFATSYGVVVGNLLVGASGPKASTPAITYPAQWTVASNQEV